MHLSDLDFSSLFAMSSIQAISQQFALVGQFLHVHELIHLFASLCCRTAVQAARQLAADILQLRDCRIQRTPQDPLIQLQHTLWVDTRPIMESHIPASVRCGRRHSLIIIHRTGQVIVCGNAADGKLGINTQKETLAHATLVSVRQRIRDLSMWKDV